MKTEWIIYTGGVISVIGTIVVLFGTLMQSQTSRSEAESLRAKIDSLHEQNEKLENIATGGDSYLKMFFVVAGNDCFKIIVQNFGDYPLSEITMWFQDMNGSNKLTNEQAVLKERESIRKLIDIRNIPPMGIMELGDVRFQVDKILGVYVIVHFGANNGTSIQIIRMKWIKDKWTTANKYIIGRNREPIYDIPKDYPALPNKDDTFNNFY